jgi:hypothetical protein
MHPTRTKIIKIIWNTGFHNLPSEFPFFRVCTTATVKYWILHKKVIVSVILAPDEDPSSAIREQFGVTFHSLPLLGFVIGEAKRSCTKYHVAHGVLTEEKRTIRNRFRLSFSHEYVVKAKNLG